MALFLLYFPLNFRHLAWARWCRKYIKLLYALRCSRLSPSLKHKWTKEATDAVRTGLMERLIIKIFFPLHSSLSCAPPLRHDLLWPVIYLAAPKCHKIFTDLAQDSYHIIIILYFCSTFPNWSYLALHIIQYT